MLPTNFRNALFICTATLVLAGAAAAGDGQRGDLYGRHDIEWKSDSHDGPCLVRQERDGSDIVDVDAKLGQYNEEGECG